MKRRKAGQGNGQRDRGPPIAKRQRAAPSRAPSHLALGSQSRISCIPPANWLALGGARLTTSASTQKPPCTSGAWKRPVRPNIGPVRPNNGASAATCLPWGIHWEEASPCDGSREASRDVRRADERRATALADPTENIRASMERHLHPEDAPTGCTRVARLSRCTRICHEDEQTCAHVGTMKTCHPRSLVDIQHERGPRALARSSALPQTRAPIARWDLLFDAHHWPSPRASRAPPPRNRRRWR